MKNEKSLMFPVIVSLNVVHKDEIYLCLCLKTIPIVQIFQCCLETFPPFLRTHLLS